MTALSLRGYLVFVFSLNAVILYNTTLLIPLPHALGTEQEVVSSLLSVTTSPLNNQGTIIQRIKHLFNKEALTYSLKCFIKTTFRRILKTLLVVSRSVLATHSWIC